MSSPAETSQVSALVVASSPERLHDATASAVIGELGAQGICLVRCIAPTTPNEPSEHVLDNWVARTDVFVDAVLALDAASLLACRSSVTASSPAVVFILIADEVGDRSERAVRQADLVVVSDRTKPAVARMPLRAPMMNIPGSDGDQPTDSWLAVLSRAVAMRTRAVGDVALHLRPIAQQEGLA